MTTDLKTLNNERKVDIHFNWSNMDQAIPHAEVYNAIGYFMQYAMHQDFIYDELSIMSHSNGREIMACYFDTKTKARFTMGAIWRSGENKYTFHS